MVFIISLIANAPISIKNRDRRYKIQIKQRADDDDSELHIKGK